MSTDLKAPLAVVEAFMAAMEAKDYDAGLVHVAADCEYTNLPMGQVQGPEGVRAVLEPFFAPIEKNEFKRVRTVRQGDLVVLERLDRHRLPDRWVELPVTGIFEVKDGKITVWREYFDLNTLVAQWPEIQALLAA